MKMSVTDAEIVVRNRVLEKNLLLPVTFDLHTMEDASAAGLGDLLKQNAPFLQFHIEFLDSLRVGPSSIAPTRYYAELYVAYSTKDPSYIKDAKLLETMANWFAEQTLDGVRFRTFRPYPKGKENGFTQYLGVIDFDFELYRGA